MNPMEFGAVELAAACMFVPAGLIPLLSRRLCRALPAPAARWRPPLGLRLLAALLAELAGWIGDECRTRWRR